MIVLSFIKTFVTMLQVHLTCACKVCSCAPTKMTVKHFGAPPFKKKIPKSKKSRAVNCSRNLIQK